MATEAVALRPGMGRLRGYAEIGGASLILGTSGALLQISSMPASLLLVLRMVAGVACGTAAGGLYATALLLMKGAGDTIPGVTFTLSFCVCTVMLLTPLAVWQTVASRYRLTWSDLGIVVVMGLVYTALCFSVFTDGLRFVPIEHAGILGYLEPVTAPIWALLLVGERPPLSTWLGGALIIAAGVFAIALGRAETEVPA